MAFVTPEELISVAYEYQLNEIAENNNERLETAIATAIKEVSGYLRPNNKKEFQDGRLVYDVTQIFNKTGDSRDALILQYTKIAALWHLTILCNVDMIYEHVKSRYEFVVDYLKKVNKGDVSLDLPLFQPVDSDGDGNPDRLPFRNGSRKKFNHE